MAYRKILITGAAGFIGFHLARRLLDEGWTVVSIDNINDYYSVALKEDRIKILEKYPHFKLYRIDLTDRPGVEGVFAAEDINSVVPVVNLAAQAGVRYARVNPGAFIQSNLVGFFNLLEACKSAATRHLVFASSSSVYGGNTKLPLSVHDNVDHPISLYAATKKSNELLAHVYAYNFNLPCTGLRFFTVYGPWGRPDMSLSLFTENILANRPITVFNYGKMQRDLTYVDDIVEGVIRVITYPPTSSSDWDRYSPDPATSWAPYRVFNIGNHRAVSLLDYIAVIEDCLGKKAEIILAPIEPGDVEATFADIDDLTREVGFNPKTPIEVGIPNFIQWFLDYHNIKI